MTHELAQHPPAGDHVEDVEISGHIIDSLILPKILDLIMSGGGSFRFKKVTIGHARHNPSYALIEVQAATAERLAEILKSIAVHGAVPVVTQDVRLVEADIAAAFPEDFHSTTNQRTEIRWQGQWIPVSRQKMDCGIVVDPQRGTATCVMMCDVQVGQQFVVGHSGVRVFPPERSEHAASFEFMNSAVSTEKPKRVAAVRVAEEFLAARRSGGRTLIVGGPAIVHTGSSEHLCRLIRGGYVDLLFAGNALATHDIENALFGTSLGVALAHGESLEAGHEHHLRAINRIRRIGGIRQAVEQGMLTSGIMYECIRHGVEFLLAGSIRDDGPLPEVITDVMVAQRRMRDQIAEVTFCLMLATTLHSVAVGNLLPAWVKVVCVDINPSAVIKLRDRGSQQTIPLVTDVEPFLRALVDELEALAACPTANS
jgi:lysine-ketoglutarate reductase/saccharopine dehydrogenase-like protein (TIGR00300 family)